MGKNNLLFLQKQKAMKTLLVTPPLIQLNTSYPATSHLLGFLKKQY